MILAVETAAERGGVALAEGEKLLGERVIGVATQQHASELLPALHGLLEELGWELARVDLIALSIGPGSFTGLRIGLATALGLCFGTSRRIVPVPTLSALSLQAGDVDSIVPMLDARKGQVYTGLYGPGGVSRRPEVVTDPLPWLRELSAELPGPLWLLGPGARLYRNEIYTVLGERAHVLAPERGQPRAAAVASLGYRLAREGVLLEPERVVPRYLRRPQAEQKRRAGHVPREPIS